MTDKKTDPVVPPLGRVTGVTITDNHVYVNTHSSVQTYDRSDIKVDELKDRLPDSVAVTELPSP